MLFLSFLIFDLNSYSSNFISLALIMQLPICFSTIFYAPTNHPYDYLAYYFSLVTFTIIFGTKFKEPFSLIWNTNWVFYWFPSSSLRKKLWCLNFSSQTGFLPSFIFFLSSLKLFLPKEISRLAFISVWCNSGAKP